MPAFGTSGLRGLVSEMTDAVVFGHVHAFLCHLQEMGEFSPGQTVLVAGDLRPSTPGILEAAWVAVEGAGGRPDFAGYIPSPALALAGFYAGVPSLMVTGSHIPFDRNGIKFNRPCSELAKSDEQDILDRLPAIDPQLFRGDGLLWQRPKLPEPNSCHLERYRRRYLDFFSPGLLDGWRIGVYQHSGVARDLMVDLLREMGAEAVPLGRSEEFVPMDTEALRPEDRELARTWVRNHRLDALVSTDGDSDRPMLADETGEWWRGDVLGLVTARFLGVRTVATPVSSSSALERSGLFPHVFRTCIGSPHVIAAMELAAAHGREQIAGFEANGGFLLGSTLEQRDRRLEPLPTRDAMLPLLAALAAASRAGCPLSSLLGDLPARFTASDRLQDFPQETSRIRLARYLDPIRGRENFAEDFGKFCMKVQSMDFTDGIRVTTEVDDIIHLRPSGNAPELRCYTESGNQERAELLLAGSLSVMEQWRPSVGA